MKGYTKIELTDVKTGEKKVVEHKNMVTNAMNDLSKGFQFLKPPLASNWFDSEGYFAKSAFGGIFLFESSLNDDPDDYLIPDSNNVVGYGCALANNTINTMMGSYNATESGVQDDGSYKHVWDFTTEQGNGEISAVALTPKYTGQAGWGTPVSLFDSSLAVSGSIYTGSEYFNIVSANANLCVKDGFLYRIPENNLIYSSSYSDRHISRSGKLKIEKLRIADEAFGMYNMPQKVSKVSKTIEVSLPSDFLDSVSASATTYYSYAQYDLGYIYVMCGTSGELKSGASFKICRIKLEDWSTETITVANTTGERFYVYGQTKLGSAYSNSVIANGKMLVNLKWSYNKYVIDLETGEISSIKYIGTDTVVASSFAASAIFDGKIIGYYYKNKTYCATVINVEDCTLAVLNAQIGSISRNGIGNDYCDYVPIVGDKLRFLAGNSSMYFCFNPFILTTKNNLDLAVTKTSAQTMKITYILTENET